MYWRLVLKYEDWPYTLARLSDVRSTEKELQQIAQSLFDAPPCCLDATMSLKIRNMFGSPQELLDSVSFRSSLKLWAKQSRVCNMHVERIFALVRKSVPDKVPNLERLVSAGYLSQILRTHMQAGGRHPCSVARGDLVADDVPINAAASMPDRMESKRRGHLLWMTEKCHAARLRKGASLTAAEQADTRREAMREWRGLDDEVRREYNKRAILQDQLESPAVVPSEAYRDDRLWCVGCKASVLRPEIAEASIKSLSGLSEIRGVSSYAGACRSRLQSLAFATDHGVPKPDDIVLRSTTCRARHKGFCRTRDGDEYNRLLLTHRRLQASLLEHDPVGHFFRLSAMRGDEVLTVLHLFVAHVRQRDPAIVVGSMFELDVTAEPSMLRLSLGDDGVLSTVVLTEIIPPLLEALPGRIRIQMLRVASSRTCLSEVSIESIETLQDLDLDAMPSKPARKVDTLEGPPVGARLAQLGADLEEAFALPQGLVDERVVRRGGRHGAGQYGAATAPRPPHARPCKEDSDSADSGGGSSTDSEDEAIALEEAILASRPKQRPNKLAAMPGGAPPQSEPPSVPQQAGAAPPVAAAPARRNVRSVDWHGWSIAPIKGGGWGATCRQRTNSWDESGTACKKMINVASMSEDEARVRVKLWLLAGLEIPSDAPDGRQRHVFEVNARALALQPEAEVDALAARLRP